MSLVLRLLACLILHPATMLVVSAVPMVEPPNNQYVASNAMEAQNYNCTVAVGYTVIWEINGIQYRSQQSQFTTSSSGIGLTILSLDSHDRVSLISFSNVTRGNISLQCVAGPLFGLRDADKGEKYFVVSFGEPDAVKNLRLVPSAGDLILTWERPSNVPREVPILYTVMINNTDTLNNSLNVTTTNSFSLRSLEDKILNNSATGICVMFEFSVSGSNDAGMGQPNIIIDTIPISPDVTLISEKLKVERVDLQPLSVQISFPPVNSCSVNFPLHNYTIKVDDEVTHVVDADAVIPDQDGKVRLKLNSTILSGVALDDSYNLTVTPCNDITCRTSNSVTLNTTDVQQAEAVFFENRLFLRCSFARSSQARGCAIILTLIGSTEMERFDLSVMSEGSTSLCTEANNQREAYSSVEALDIEANGSDGVVRVNINSTVTVLTTEDEYVAMTGCRLPITSDSTAAIVGGVTGGILGLLIVIVIIVIVILGGIYGWWCARLNPEDMDDIKKGLGTAQPLLALAGGAAAMAAAEGRDISPQATTSKPLMETKDLEAAHPLPALVGGVAAVVATSAKEGEGSPQTTASELRVTSDSGGRKPKKIHQKLKNKKYMMVKTEYLLELIGDKYDLQP